MSEKKIGPHEQQLRDMREANAAKAILAVKVRKDQSEGDRQ